MRTHFLDQARGTRAPWWGHPVVLACAVCAFVAASLGYYHVLRTGLGIHAADLDPVVRDLLPIGQIASGFAGATVGLALGLRFVHKRAFATLLADGRGFPWRDVAIGFALFAPLVAIGGVLTGAELAPDLAMRLAIVLPAAVVAFLIQGGSEEIFFRGYLPQELSRRIRSRWVVGMITTVLFGLLHFGYGIGSLISTTAFAGTMFYIVAKRGNLGSAVGLHAANNAVIATCFTSLDDVVSAGFDWKVNPVDVGLELGSLVIVGLVCGWLPVRRSETKSP